MNIDILNLVLAILAIIISIFSIWLQYTVEGAKVDVLNDKDIQRIIPRSHPNLPQDIKEKYPYVPDAQAGYAVLKIVFGNAGDRPGLIRIQNIQISIKGTTLEIIKASCFDYALVPAYDVVEKEILLSNIPLGPNEFEVEISLTIVSTRYHPKTSKNLGAQTFDRKLHAVLIPGTETPWLVSG